MHAPPHRSAGVTAAAALAVMGNLLAFLFWIYMLLPLVNVQDAKGRHFYQLFPVVFLVFAIVPPLLVALGIQTGIGLFRLREWARRLALVEAALALVLCLTMIALRPFETFVIPENFVSELESFKQLLAIAFIFLLLPTSIWWLFFFRRPGVKAQFQPSASQTPDASS